LKNDGDTLYFVRIAFISYFGRDISLHTPSGIEAYTYQLVKGLAQKNEVSQIDVYGVGHDYISDEKINFIPLLSTHINDFIYSNEYLRSALWHDYTLPKLQYAVAIKAMKEILHKRYDIIHDNSTIPLFASCPDILKIPVLTTIHTVINTASIAVPYALNLFSHKKGQNYFVTISDYQRKKANEEALALNILQTIHNGIDPMPFTFTNVTKKNSYALWLGRIHRVDNKGLKETIIISKKTKKHIKIIGAVFDEEYYEEIKKEVGKGTFVELIDKPVSFERKISLYQNASYLLYPLEWEEPFGLVFIEAMACGTPIIAFARGSVPEIIKDGETGYIVNYSETDKRGDWIVKKSGLEGIIEAMKRINEMSDEEYKRMRENCRKRVEEFFSAQKMAGEYLSVYKMIVQQTRKKSFLHVFESLFNR